MKSQKKLAIGAIVLLLSFSGTAYAAVNNSPTVSQGLGLCRITAMRGVDFVTSILKNKLNLSYDDITKAISSGKTPYQIAEENGMTLEQFKSAMVEEKSKAIDAAVKAGTITKDEAAKLKAAINANIQNCTGTPRGFYGNQRGRGQGRGLCNFNGFGTN